MRVSGVEERLSRRPQVHPRRPGTVTWLGTCLAPALLATACSPAELASPPEIHLDGYRPANAASLRSEGWRTDLGGLAVPLERILLGGPAREAFVPVDPVHTASADEVELDAEELVLVVRDGESVRGWPIAHLAARELALDEVGGAPVAVTYCSLCASARVWDRRLDGEMLDLAVSGLLLEGNSLLYDRASESLWRQLTGEAVAGAHAGRRLAALPSFTVSFGELRSAHPAARVMLAPSGPEPPIDRIDAGDVARGEPPAWLHTSCPDPLATVLALPGELVPLERGPAVRDLGGTVVLFGAAFRAEVDGRRLAFEGARDVGTGSTWNALGEAVAGPLAGRRLEPTPQTRVFRFAAPAGGLKLSGP